MKYGRIPGVDRPVSRLVMGTTMLSPDDMDGAGALLDDFVALGGTTVDTARVYGRGGCEQAVGQWLAGRDRAGIVLIGKGAHHDEQGPRVTPEAIEADLAASLQALQTDYIDLYLLHRDDPARPVREIMECLDAQYRAGRIRAYGGSNWTPARIEEANAYARAHDLQPFVAGSPNFSLAVFNEPPWPDCLTATGADRRWYVEHQFPLLAWSSQAQGFFTGRFSPDDRSSGEMVRVWYSEENWERMRRAEELGRRKGGYTANQVALAYVLCQPFPIFALIGPHTREELRSSIVALEIDLTPEELARLNLES